MQYNLPVLPDVHDYPHSAISDCGTLGVCRHCHGCCKYYMVRDVPSMFGDPDSKRIDKLPGDICPQAIINARGHMFCALHGNPGKPDACQNWVGNQPREGTRDTTQYQHLVGSIAQLFLLPEIEGIEAEIGEDYRQGRIPPEVAQNIRKHLKEACQIDLTVGRVYFMSMLQRLLVTDVPEPFPWALLDAVDLSSIITPITKSGAVHWGKELQRINIDCETNPLHRKFCQRYGLPPAEE